MLLCSEDEDLSTILDIGYVERPELLDLAVHVLDGAAAGCMGMYQGL